MHGTRFPARSFDGLDPNPTDGELELGDTGFRFAPADGAARDVPYRAVRNCYRVGDRLHIEIQPGAPDRPPEKIITVAEVEPRLHEAVVERGAGGAQELLFQLKRVKVWAWVLLALLVLPAGYLLATRGAPMAHVFFSVKFEEKLSELIYEDSFSAYPVCDDPALTEWLQGVVARLRPDGSPYTYRVTVLESEQANAMALPGGRLVVLSGLLDHCDDPAVLAGILAHEIAHVEERHGLKQLLRALGIVAFMANAVGGGIEELEGLETAAEFAGFLAAFKYSRDAEREADAEAVRYLHRHGYSARGLQQFFETMQEEAGRERVERALRWLSTHPMSSERVAFLRSATAEEAFEPRTWLEGGVSWEAYREACGGGPAAGEGGS